MDRPFNALFIIETIPRLLAFFPVTLLVVLVTVLAGNALGFTLARARIGGGAVRRKIAEAYTMAMRCTPSIVLLFIVYYGLPVFMQNTFDIDINGWKRAAFVIIALTLLFGASMSEVMRSAYLAIDRGQREAALSIGLSEAEAFFRIVFPQAVNVALPNFCNALLNLFKEGSLAYTIGLIDMMGQGTVIVAQNFGSYGLETYIALAIVYWTLTVIIERAFLALEKRLSRGRRSYA